jgi:hypothetical protein
MLTTLLAAVPAIMPAMAKADIHRCMDADGLITFTDSPSRKFKECTLLYRDNQGAPPAQRTGPGAGAPAQGQGQGQGQGAARPRTESPAAATRGNPGPENFPRVDRGEQRDRDLKARQIVERELSNEQRLLEEARRQIATLGPASGDRPDPRLRESQNAVARHERNIAEIQRQLALMK